MLINYQELRWKGDKLMYGSRNTGAKIIPDAQWPGMYRVEYPPGVISDMTNLTRARDAAISIVAHHLKTVETTSGALAGSVISPALGRGSLQSQKTTLTTPSSLAA